MFSSAKIQKILHLTQYLSSFYYLCTNYFRNETKNSITLHHVATFDVSITRSGSQRRGGGQHRRDDQVSSLLMPNAFSPNGDGINDIYKPKDGYRNIEEFHAYIYNRWGQKLYEWTDPATGWNGTYRGKPVKEGVYFCLVKAKGADGVVYNIKRDVNLLRGYTEEQNSNY